MNQPSQLQLFEIQCELESQLNQLRSMDKRGFTRVQLQLELPSLLQWLNCQQLFPRFFWRNRSGSHQIAAIGEVLAVHDFNTLERVSKAYFEQDKDLLFYGGIGFDPRGGSWRGYSQQYFFIPRIEVERLGNQCLLQVNLDLNGDEQKRTREYDAALTALNRLCLGECEEYAAARLRDRTDSPALPEWRELVTEALQLPEIHKVVLSRQTSFTTRDKIAPWQLLEGWGEVNANCYQFGLQFDQHSAFFGCSPERLYQRHGDQLNTEALAGTGARGATPQEDHQLANALLHDGKNIHENRLVQQDILSRLEPLCHAVRVEDKRQLLKLASIQHLRRRIEAQLKSSVSDCTLLSTLHPTPAIGGVPRERALTFIRQHETYSRGWYAGACGFIGADNSEFCVTIRSARTEPGKLHLFAGAGLVEGSNPDLEWQELDNKIKAVLSLIQVEN